MAIGNTGVVRGFLNREIVFAGKVCHDQMCSALSEHFTHMSPRVIVHFSPVSLIPCSFPEIAGLAKNLEVVLAQSKMRKLRPRLDMVNVELHAVGACGSTALASSSMLLEHRVA